MRDDEQAPEQQPADTRDPGVAKLFAGMVVAPLAWALEMLVGYTLAAHACYPADVALAAPTWANLRMTIEGVSIALWLLLFVGVAIAWSNWKATRRQSNVDPHRMVQSGDGRPRFMALCGVIVSGLFTIVLLFTSIGILWVPTCGP
jgi:hypothetical protein